MFGWWRLDGQGPSGRQGDPFEPGAAPTAVAAAVREPPPTTAMLGPTVVPGCPEMDAEPIGPSLAESANLLMAELRDRARHLRNDGAASADLREGLRALGRGDETRALALLRSAPDRRRDDFDLAAAAAFTVVVRALGEERDPGPAIDVLADVEGEGPLTPLARAVVARRDHDEGAELAALTAAFRVSDDPAVAFALASTAIRQGWSALGLAALRAYLQQFPDDPWGQQMLPVLERRAAIEASMVEVAAAGITVRYPPSLGARRARGLLVDVRERLGEAAALLGTPRRPLLTVVVYPDRETFQRATCGPLWSGGLYDGSLRLRAEEDAAAMEVTVRHESLHAQLAHVAPSAPLWLHEGLAQVFQEQVPRDLRRTLELMGRERTYVPFPSLEGSFVVIDDPDSARFAYHQSYAMVAALLEREGPVALRRAVTHLAGGGAPGELIGAMSSRPFEGDDLLQWLRGWSATPVP